MDRRAPEAKEPDDDARLAELLEEEIAIDDERLDDVAAADSARLDALLDDDGEP